MADANAGRVAGALASLEREKATGLLRVGADGAFHVDRGAVTLAESRHAPGPGDLPDGPDPELAALLAMFDAACLLLASRAEPEFTEGRRAAAPAGDGGDARPRAAPPPRPPRRRLARRERGRRPGGAGPARHAAARHPDRPPGGDPAQRRRQTHPSAARPRARADGVRVPARRARARRGVAAPDRPARRVRRRARPGGARSARSARSARPRRRPRRLGAADWAPTDHDLLVRLHAALVELR
ncbi:hypothetical protein ACFQY7_41785 [Actinomadura luteofluorescens]|uniref:hypothetical protein n=1 Tax=Actinomadura luteofluorescens TaxID=46163 RepID=UPI00362D8E8F